MTTRRKRWKN